MYNFNSSNQEAEAGEWRVWAQPGQHSEMLFKQKKRNKTKTKGKGKKMMVIYQALRRCEECVLMSRSSPKVLHSKVPTARLPREGKTMDTIIKSSVAGEGGGLSWWSAEGFSGRETTQCDTVLVDTSHYTLSQAHSCHGLGSVWVHQLHSTSPSADRRGDGEGSVSGDMENMRHLCTFHLAFGRTWQAKVVKLEERQGRK